MLRSAKTNGALLCLDDADYYAIQAKYSREPDVTPAPEHASLPTKARRLAVALLRWARGGFGLVAARTRRRRRQACAACIYWRAAGNARLGECQAPGCGCTRAKWWLSTERCPLGKWPGEPLQPRFSPPATRPKPGLFGAFPALENPPDS